MLAEAELDALVAEVIPDPELATAMVERECESCGVRFLRRAPHARFCSDRCRMRAFRAGRKPLARVESARQARNA